MKSRFLNILFSLSVICFQGNLLCQTEDQVDMELITTTKVNAGAIEQRVRQFFNELVHLMRKCDHYIAYWCGCEKNIGIYMIGNLNIKNWKNERRDTLMKIKANIAFLRGKKREYALLLGKLYNAAESFIEEKFKMLSLQEQEALLDKLALQIDDLVSDSIYQKQMEYLRSFGPPDRKRKRQIVKYAGIFGALIAAGLLVYYRKPVFNFLERFFKNHIVRPLVHLKNCVFGSASKHRLTGLSVDDLARDLDAQTHVVTEKFKDLVTQVDPDVSREALDAIIEQAKDDGLEHFIGRCMRIVAELPHGKRPTTRGWIEWLFLGDRVNRIFGMDPQSKLLELEIKALLSRLSATKMMLDAKEALDSNKLTLVMASGIPAVIALCSAYAIYKKVYNRVTGVYRKRQEINRVICQINEIINRNINNDHLSDVDQGFLCFFASRFKRCLPVVPVAMRSSFEKDITYISSSSNSIDKKLQILQSMKIMLYAG